MNTPPVLTVQAAAECLECEPDTVREMARAGKLPGLKVGRDWVFPSGAFFCELERMASEAAEKRRTPPEPSGVLHQIGEKKRRPPVLPQLGAMESNDG